MIEAIAIDDYTLLLFFHDIHRLHFSSISVAITRVAYATLIIATLAAMPRQLLMPLHYCHAMPPRRTPLFSFSLRCCRYAAIISADYAFTPRHAAFFRLLRHADYFFAFISAPLFATMLRRFFAAAADADCSILPR